MLFFPNIHFLRPYWFLALIPIALLLIALLWYKRYQSNWAKVCDKHLLPALLVGQQNLQRQWPVWGFITLLCAIVVALAGPSWSYVTQPVYRTASQYVIALDASINMQATDIKPTRLAQAKLKIRQLLRENQTANIGMLAFTHQAFVVSPLTEDANTIELLVPNIDTNIMPVQGSDVNQALKKAATLLNNSAQAERHILLVTASPINTQAMQTARRLHTQGITTSVYATGTTQGGPIKNADGSLLSDTSGAIVMPKVDFAAAQQLAQAGGGRAILMRTDNQDIQALQQLLASQPQQQDMRSEQSANIALDQGRYLIWFLLPLFALAFRRGWLEKL
jgi:Ca-activated chloride channel family protein